MGIDFRYEVLVDLDIRADYLVGWKGVIRRD
jgi:hypothetical protein